MIRPTTIPQAMQELKIEQAIAREALRLAFKQHKAFAVGLKGIQQERTISDAFDQTSSGETLVKMMELDILVGSGGALSHAPRRSQGAHMMIDAFQPEGVTRLAVDSIFMMPQLGVLSTVHRQAATQVFEKDCLIHLGTVIAPVGQGKEGKECIRVRGKLPNGTDIDERIPTGELVYYPLDLGAEAQLKLEPTKTFDVGAGPGRDRDVTVQGGVVGLLIDTRGRPLDVTAGMADRVAKIEKWNRFHDQVVAHEEDHGIATRRV
jgi:hypothetical protein